MPEPDKIIDTEEQQGDASSPGLETGTYEIIRNRLLSHGEELRGRIDKLNAARKATFGAIEPTLISTERVTTANNCVPRDMIAVGNVLLFGYNVHIGLRSEYTLEDVFACYLYEDHQFRDAGLDIINDEQFRSDFSDLYRYYKSTIFAKFAVIGPHLFMVFRVGKAVSDVKTFKWAIDGEKLVYMGNRSDHEYRFPSQHEFEWTRCTREMHRNGKFPHVSIEDRIFVETVGGDLTIKVEDNTESGAGIFSEPVDDPDQTLDDSEMNYACVGNLILLKIKPYQEKDYRYIVYSEKAKSALRIDDLQNSCVLLPEDHGLIFSSGYYLQTGEYKTFDNNLPDMLFEKRIPSSNGEDTLYEFFNRESGTYILLSYNMIERVVDTPIVCHGYSLFENGELIYFRAQNEPQKYHAIQIWQTPYTGPNYVTEAEQDSYLYKIGNRDIVRCMAGCNTVLNLITREDSYANLYLDIVKQSTDLLDAYFWIKSDDACNLGQPLLEIRNAAKGAIDEYEKVLRMRRSAVDLLASASQKMSETVSFIRKSRFEHIDEFVKALADLRSVRGEVISLRDVRYMDLTRVDGIEKELGEEAEAMAQKCVEFLLKPESLDPYNERVAAIEEGIPALEKVADAKAVEEEVSSSGSELEMLIDIVSNLKIEDTTQRTTIIESISDIYSNLNRVRSALKNKIQSLASVEGVAEFGSQMKLLNQAVINYLDVCDTPERCEEYLSKVMIQLEELEGRFAEFDEFVVQLSEKREEIYNAFESRKIQLVEVRNKKADALMRSAERILKGIRTRAATMETVTEINGYFASDLMIEKVRDVITQLEKMGDSVKADDVQSRLKTIQQDSVRQLKDKQELFVGGENVIQLGNHHFSVNTQALDLTVVRRDDDMFLHLTGTDFFERITDEKFNATRAVWSQEIVSETDTVYRSEYLAYLIFDSVVNTKDDGKAEELLAMDEKGLAAYTQQFMAPRYAEGYVKGVHDRDASLILRNLLELHRDIGMLRYHTRARALARVFWEQFGDRERKRIIESKMKGFGALTRVFRYRGMQNETFSEIKDRIAAFAASSGLFDETLAPFAAEYLLNVMASGKAHPVSVEAADIHKLFNEHVTKMGASGELSESLGQLGHDVISAFSLLRDWVEVFISANENMKDEYRDEVAALLYVGGFESKDVSPVSIERKIGGMSGSHALLVEGEYNLHFTGFMVRLENFRSRTVPAFETFQQMKKQFVDEARDEMRLEEFRPRVLTSFVRNRLLDKVYLPLVGDNLAKQIGVVGNNKRTDLMGLLLLVSPPGYGKTTLMEYIANRMGIIFMKINGPAIGHQVTSLDPSEAPNAAAREELEKLSLSLEMGDNVMIYLDDIQHCNPEFLQKFISLCDAQRKIEGVYKGRTRTYDLRGKKVCVVMAGNPYTESGEAFKIPDMLANRADTYNLGDIIGDNAEWFKLSYIENALTSNPVLGKLASRSQKDVLSIIKIAETGVRDGVELEGNYSADEMGEFVSVITKLLRVRDVILSVNLEYIRSAAQADEYRTEPAFKLQGSYRNMNRIAEKVMPVMNHAELELLVMDHYQNESQTLTTGAEANLLKFKELSGKQSETEVQRWKDIK
ncbi:MAG: DNA repair ATPase, partial [Planctomycetes bacterium]|nr:DNA repair ATPase [Planctomycetota bacterium]